MKIEQIRALVIATVIIAAGFGIYVSPLMPEVAKEVFADILLIAAAATTAFAAFLAFQKPEEKKVVVEFSHYPDLQELHTELTAIKQQRKVVFEQKQANHRMFIEVTQSEASERLRTGKTGSNYMAATQQVNAELEALQRQDTALMSSEAALHKMIAVLTEAYKAEGQQAFA